MAAPTTRRTPCCNESLGETLCMLVEELGAAGPACDVSQALAATARRLTSAAGYSLAAVALADLGAWPGRVFAAHCGQGEACCFGPQPSSLVAVAAPEWLRGEVTPGSQVKLHAAPAAISSVCGQHQLQFGSVLAWSLPESAIPGLLLVGRPGEGAAPAEELRWLSAISRFLGAALRRHELERALAVRDRLTALALQDGNHQAMVGALAEITGNAVVLEDRFLHQIAAAGAVDEVVGGTRQGTVDVALRDRRLSELLRLLGEDPGPVYWPRHSQAGMPCAHVTVPVSLSGEALGYLSILEHQRPLDALDLVVAREAAVALALDFTKERARQEVRRQLHSDFLEQLCRGVDVDEQVEKRAHYLGWDVARRHRALIVALDPEASGDTGDAQGKARSPSAAAEGRLLDAVAAFAYCDSPETLVAARAGRAVIVWLSPSDGEVEDLEHALAFARRVQDEVRQRLCPRLRGCSIGVGRAYDGLPGVRDSVQEAEEAPRVLHSFGGTSGVIAFERIGIYALLAKVADRDSLAACAAQVLGPVRQYDIKHGGSLLPTLACYLHHGNNLRLAAARLNIHPHTLRYRLDRVRALAQLDPEDCLSAQLALKILALEDASLLPWITQDPSRAA